MTLHRYTTEQIKEEISRRQAATPRQKALAALRSQWEVPNTIAARAGLPRWQCGGELSRLAHDGKAEWTVLSGETLWRLAG